MGRYISDVNRVGFIYESGTYANPSGNVQWIGLVQEHTIDEEENIEAVRYVGTGDRNVGTFEETARDVTGTITYYPQDWKFLAFTLGSCNDEWLGSPAEPKTHTISETISTDGNAFTSGVKSPFISFTIYDSHKYVDGKNFNRKVIGCMVDSMTISASQGEFVSCEVNYVAQDVEFSSGAQLAISAATTKPFRWSHVQVHIPSGTVIDNLKEFNLTINNNIEAPHYLNGSRVVDVPIPLNRDYELTLTLDSDSENAKTFYEQYYRNGSTFNAMIKISESDTREAFIILSGCRLVDMEAPTPHEGTNESTLTIHPQTATVIAEDAIEKYNAW